jgi:hypothetical protein
MRVFLSYGRDQYAAIAERIAERLKARGMEVWLDSARLRAGVDWESYIDEGLDWAAQDPAGSLLLLMTPHSVRRPDGFCLNELARANQRGLRIIPVMLSPSTPPLSICRIQWLDMCDCLPLPEQEARFVARFDRLVQALVEDKLDFDGQQSRLLRLLKPLPFDAEIEDHVRRFTGR